MRANKWCRGLTAFLAASMLAGMYPSSAAASDYKLGYNTNARENDYVFTTKSPKGTIGKSMSIPFRIRATDEDMENLRISLLETNEFQQIEERGNGDYSVDYYPFEIMETTFVAKNVGTIKKGNVKSVSLSARVRRDALQGYYSIPVLLEWDGGSDTDYINELLCSFRQNRHFITELITVVLEIVMEEKGDILTPLAQRRNV